MIQNVKAKPMCLGVALLVLGGPLMAIAKGGTPPCGYNVTSNIAPTDSNNNPFQLQPDGLGAYYTYGNTKSQTDKVLSVIQGNSCDWLLDLSSSASRTVVLTLAYPATTGASTLFANPTTISPRIISICSENTNNNGVTYGTMTYAGQTALCGFHASFNYNGNSYALHLNPASTTLQAGTTWVQVTCEGAQNSQCVSWAVIPDPNPSDSMFNSATNQNSAVGELVLITTSKGKTVRTDLGLYEVAFSITITNP